MDTYNTIMKFIKWCEANDYTEWMGYHKMAEEILAKYFEYLRESEDSKSE